MRFNDRTVAEHVLEPIARGLRVTRPYVEQVCQRHMARGEWADLVYAAVRHNERYDALLRRVEGKDIKRALARKVDRMLDRYEQECAALKMAEDIMGAMLYGSVRG